MQRMHLINLRQRIESSIPTLTRLVKKQGMSKKSTMHIARHSFGNIAGDAIHPLMLQKLYRHSDLKTTLNYQANFIHKDADDALDSVVNFSF